MPETTNTSTKGNVGKITRVIGPVVDVEFPPASCPASSTR